LGGRDRAVPSGDVSVLDPNGPAKLAPSPTHASLPAADAWRARVEDPARLAALAATELLDSEPEEAFDRLVRLATDLLGAPVGLVSLVDDDRQFFKAAVGVPEPWATRRETPLTHSFCKHAVASGEPLVVDDARVHPIVKDNAAIADLGVVAYLGVPLVTAGHVALGVLCVADVAPRAWQPRDVRILRELAVSVMREIEMRGALAALHASEESRNEEHRMLRCVVESIGAPLLVTDLEGQVVLANLHSKVHPAADGLDPAVALRRAQFFLADGKTPCPPEELPFVRASKGEHVEGVVMAMRMPAREDVFWFSVTASPLNDADGAITGAVSVFRDITAAHGIEQAFARSQEIYRSVLATLPNTSVVVFDRDLRFISADGEQLLGNLGLTREALVGRRVQEFLSDPNREMLLARYVATLEGASSTTEAVRDGRALEIHMRPIRDVAGAVVAGLVMSYDVTEARKAQETASHERALLQSIVENMGEAVIAMDHDRHLLVFNRAARDMIGDPGRGPGSPEWEQVVTLCRQDGRTPLRRAELPIVRALAGEATDQTLLVARTKRKPAPFDISITARPLRDETGATFGGVSVIRDVSAQRAQDRALRDHMRAIALLQSTALAANEAQAPADAFRRCLAKVCAYLGWPVGHVYELDGVELAPSDSWYVDTERGDFSAFREATAATRFAKGTGWIGGVAEQMVPTWITSIEDEPEFVRAQGALASGLQSGFMVPVLVGSTVVAVLELYALDKTLRDDRVLSLVSTIGTQLGRVVEREQAREQLHAHAQSVREMSMRDELTGLYNRRGFLEVSRQHLKLAQRTGRHAAMFFVDLNGMKDINDELGHEEGDRALADTGKVLAEAMRASDLVARLGGDEFAVLALEVEPTLVGTVIGRVQTAVAEHNARAARRYRLSLSIGVAVFDPAAPCTVEKLLTDADALMYEQKRAGRLARARTKREAGVASRR
jgi:diguanylate cyclase (GGDEF)-like protein/PAS domain S-box-containing protein